MMGRPTIYGRADGMRVQGTLTKEGEREFEQHRTALKLLHRHIMGFDFEPVSDANTIEFLARGVRKTTKYLKAKKQAQRK